jgi:hypothetical protein
VNGPWVFARPFSVIRAKAEPAPICGSALFPVIPAKAGIHFYRKKLPGNKLLKRSLKS